jgi:hypothetical protein
MQRQPVTSFSRSDSSGPRVTLSFTFSKFATDMQRTVNPLESNTVKDRLRIASEQTSGKNQSSSRPGISSRYHA